MDSILAKLQQLGRLSLDWIKTHPNSIFSLIGIMLLISGQLYIFSSKVLLGAELSILGGLLIIIPWLAGPQLIKLFNMISVAIQKAMETAKTKSEPSKKILAEGQLSEEISSVPAEQESIIVPHELATPLPPVQSAWQKKLERQLLITKKQLIILGIAFFVISQPLLMMEKYLLAMLFILPSVLLLGKSLFLKKDYQWSISLKILLLNGGLLIPGLAMIIAGNVILLNIIKLGNSWEMAGLGLNGLGIVLLYLLFPKKLEDPEPTRGNVLECHDGHARTAKGVALKILFVILAVILFIVLRVNAGQMQINQQLILVFTMLGFLFLSFPWKFQRQAEPVEGTSNKNILLKLLRLAAFIVALYLGYRGQHLISHEQLYPGLYRFFWAALALLVAFKEPSMHQSVDSNPDKSFKWYFELLGLVIIMAVGTWIRFHLLDSVPYGVECDEAGSGWAAMQALYEKLPSIIVAKEGGRPLFMLMPKVISFKLFGVDTFSLKFMSAIWGVLGVAALYFMARHMFGIKAAMGAAALLSLSRIQIHFSRYGWSNTLMILLLTIGFYFLLKGLDNRKKIYFFLSGVVMSLTVQTETAARLLPLICGAVLIYLLITQHKFLYRNWKPLLVMMLGVWIAGAGIFAFWIQKPEFLIKRVQEVSIFSEDVNAPGNLVQGLVKSTKLSLTQLNWHGDYRPRHNGGLSGEPILDFWTAILFALGFVFSLYYWKKLKYFILFIWFIGFICGSVMSLEAPQTHRAFGLLPAAFLLIAAFLDHSRRLLSATLGRWGVIAGSVAFLLMLWPIANINYHKYFDTQPAFDGNCSAAAKYIGSPEWKDAQHYIMSAYLWMGHPPFKFYAPSVAANFYYQPSHLLPNRIISDKDALYTSILEYQPVIDLVKWFYPEGAYKEEFHNKYGMMFRSYGVTQENLLAKQGLTASYWNNTNWSGEPALKQKDSNLAEAFDHDEWPLEGNGSVAWQGTILIPHEGDYTFYLAGQDYVEVKIGKQVRLQSSNQQEVKQSIWLAGGLHTFRAKAKYTGTRSKIGLTWRGDTIAEYLPNSFKYKLAFSKTEVPNDRFYVYPEPIGLLETMYGNDSWQGRPLRQTIEPLPFFFWHSTPYGYSPPLSFDWRGFITIPESGSYHFELPRNGYRNMSIGGKTIVASGRAGDSVATSKTRPQNPIVLEKGKYPINIRWAARQGWAFKFWWTKPDGTREIVPGWMLSPAAEKAPRD